LFTPFTLPLFWLIRIISPKSGFSPFGESHIISKEKLLELIRDVDDGNLLNEHDKKLFYAVLNFRDRIAREVMVPRVNLFSVPHDLTIAEAAALIEKEGYSRIPIYKNSPDEIIGVLMYKDVLLEYMRKTFDKPVDSIMKKVLYTPETKKISLLLQEFRKKQIHMAIVVDEYGGTAGIVTIEDILEEIVGEIADEYDQESALFHPAGKGAWIVDARMNLLDLEEELGIKIPEEGEYDTISGYVFFCLGTIPQKGVIIHHDQFELEILSSNDRVVEKVKITPLAVT
ncbi:MAG: hypothetical protein JWO53_1262, partial [Chlamydiia bacterium]|nr:hypothetical protein [Chlamydiia bacterium]